MSWNAISGGILGNFLSFGGSPGSPEVAENPKKNFVAQSPQKHHFFQDLWWVCAKTALPKFFRTCFPHFLDIWHSFSSAHDGFVPEPTIVKYKEFLKIQGICGNNGKWRVSGSDFWTLGDLLVIRRLSRVARGRGKSKKKSLSLKVLKNITFSRI